MSLGESIEISFLFFLEALSSATKTKEELYAYKTLPRNRSSPALSTTVPSPHPERVRGVTLRLYLSEITTQSQGVGLN